MLRIEIDMTAKTFNISAKKKTKSMNGKHPYSTDHIN